MVQKNCTLEEKQKSIIGFLTISLQCFFFIFLGGGACCLVLYYTRQRNDRPNEQQIGSSVQQLRQRSVDGLFITSY